MTLDHKCDRCSTAIPLEAQFCPNCGARLAESRESSPDHNPVDNLPDHPAPNPYSRPESQVPVAAETRKDDGREGSQQLAPGTCPVCSYPNLPGASICERCNAKMWLINRSEPTPDRMQPVQDGQPPTEAGSETQPQRNIGAAVQSAPSAPHPWVYGATTGCERCGTVNRSDAASCVNCGLPFENKSPEGVPYEVFRLGNPAGFWIRFLAFILDGAIVFGIGAIIWPLLFGETFWIKETTVTRDGFNTSTSTFFRTQDWHTLMWLLYSILFLAVLGATPGKILLKVRVYDGRGRRGIGFIRATIRTFSMWLSALTILIGFIMVGFRKDKRSLHDLIAGTYPTSRW